jgi:hypothetical protein
MSYQFPADVAYLPRTKLAYVNLPGILTDGKRDRAGRVSGYVSIQLGERCYLVFLRGGEAFNAARLQRDGRGAVALSEVVRLVATESERGEAGQIGYFGASEAQLQAMLDTLVNAPVAFDQPIDVARPDQLFPHLRDRRFTGVLELSDGRRFHYVLLEEGQYRTGWFADRDPAVPAGDFIRTFFASAGANLRATPYPSSPALPVQAGPGFVDLYRRIVGGVMRDLSQTAGRETAMGIVRRAQDEAAREHPCVAAFNVTDEGRISGDPVAAPGELTEGAAAWVTEVLIHASDNHGLDPAATLERVARDSRFVLAEHGFFNRVPWAISL